MKQTNLLTRMLLLCALIVGSTYVWAEDTKTVEFKASTVQSSDAITGTNWSQTYVEHRWTSKTSDNAATIYFGGMAGKQSSMIAIKNTHFIGNIDPSYDASASFKDNVPSGAVGAIPGKITKIEVSCGGNTSRGIYISVHTSQIVGNTSAEGITKSQKLTGESVSQTYSSEKGYKYFYIEGANSSYSGINSVKITYEEEAAIKTDPTITFNNGSVRVGKTLDLSTLFESNSSGAVTYSITAGDSYASITGSTLTGVAEGSVTVEASQAAAGSYNAKTATATISVEAALALNSIAITTAPTKTTYQEGEAFDAAGMVVTATYSDGSTDDVTALCTWTPNGALAPANKAITVSYTENGVTKTAEQDITVEEYTQPTPVEITLNNAFFEVSTGQLAATYTTIEGKQDGVKIVLKRNSGSQFYFETTKSRLYPKYTMEITAPNDYLIESVALTSSGTWTISTISTSEGTTYDSNTKTCTVNEAGTGKSSITFTLSGSGQAHISNIAITLAPAAVVTDAKYATYVTTQNIDFANSTGVTAYKATKATDSSIKLEEISAAPKGTAVVLAATAKTYALKVAETKPTAVTGNILQASDGSSIVGDYVDNGDGTFESTYFVLGISGGNVGFAPLANGIVLAKGKAYIHKNDWPAKEEAKQFLPFDTTGETTNINLNVNANANDNAPVYNLAGQRVGNGYKGIVIVNGKKVVRK